MILNQENYTFDLVKSTVRTLEDGSKLEIKTLDGKSKEKKDIREKYKLIKIDCNIRSNIYIMKTRCYYDEYRSFRVFNERKKY